MKDSGDEDASGQLDEEVLGHPSGLNLAVGDFSNQADQARSTCPALSDATTKQSVSGMDTYGERERESRKRESSKMCAAPPSAPVALAWGSDIRQITPVTLAWEGLHWKPAGYKKVLRSSATCYLPALRLP